MMPAMPIAFVEGDLLYHTVHGLCRLDKVSNKSEAGKNETVYSLIPHTFKRGELRYTFSAAALEDSGFHPLVTVADAYAILVYLKKGFPEDVPSNGLRLNRTFAEDNQTWGLAKFLLSCTQEGLESKELRKRQVQIHRAARGLIIELAFVLQLPLSEVVFQVRKNLEATIKLHPLIVQALNEANQS